MMSAARELQSAPDSAARSQFLQVGAALVTALEGRVRVTRYLLDSFILNGQVSPVPQGNAAPSQVILPFLVPAGSDVAVGGHD